MCKFKYERKATLVHARGVSAQRGNRLVLRDLDLEIRDIVRDDLAGQGQVVAVLGPSGVGKTSLFRVLAGLDAPLRGEVLVTERQVPVQPGMVGVVHQSYPLFDHRTVLGNLVVAARAAGADRVDATGRALAYLERFGLADRADAWPAQLSGGQRQRVAILQQIMRGHTYILLDEPFSGLDPLSKAKACELVVEMSRMDELATIILVTHDIGEAVKVADTLCLMGRDRTASGELVAGSRIVTQYDLVERDLAWQPGIERTREFAELVREVEDRFATL